MENQNILPAEYLESSRQYIREDMKNIAVNFLKLGYHLRELHRDGTYAHAGYNSVAEFAETEFGIKKSTCYNFIKLVETYSQNGNSIYLDEDYEGFGYSQLVEMLSLPEEKRIRINPDMSIVQIREVKKFGWVVDREKQKEEIRKYCAYVKDVVKPFSRENVKDYIARACRSHNSAWFSDYRFSFSPGSISLEDYHYTPASFLECIEKYVGFEEDEEELEPVQTSGTDEDEEEPEPVQTSGMDENVVEPESFRLFGLSFEEAHDQVNDTPLADVLMTLLKNNIKNVDKVKAIIEYLNSLG